MKIFLCLLLISACYCLKDSQVSESRWREPTYHDGHHSRHGHEVIEYPCSLQDLNCIRQYFAHNSRCTPVYGSLAEPLLIEMVLMDIPLANMSMTLYDVLYVGTSAWKINNFFVNKKTGQLVFEVVFSMVSADSPATVMKFHRRGKEPIILKDRLAFSYQDQSLTLTVPDAYDINMSKSHVFGSVGDSDLIVVWGEKFLTNRNPKVRTSIKALMANPSITLQETLVLAAPFYMSAFLDTVICKF